MGRYIAVDLGATSGRVALVDTSSGSFDINLVHRFPHEVVELDGKVCWNWDLIVTETLVGIKKAAALGPVTSLAIDAWAVDYGFLDKAEALLPPIVSYRDPRIVATFADIPERIGRERIYSTTGIQFISLNTIYQLTAATKDANYLAADIFLLLPDLLNNVLTGSRTTEITNASTTQLLNSHSRQWDFDLIEMLGLNPRIFPELHEPGTTLGVIRGHGELDGITVVATGSHDTASAVAGAPMSDPLSEAYLSSGTWSLLGIESATPFTNQAALDANLTNELGVDNTVRVLKNITGLWIFEECRRAWRDGGQAHEVEELIALARKSTFDSVINPNDPIFATPADMPAKVARYCSDSGQPAPEELGDFVRTIFLSLALAYQVTMEEIESVTARSIKKVHILGGGSQNNYLNQLAADALGKIVSAGPAESTLLGNVAMQAIAAGEFADLAGARAAIARSVSGALFTPQNEIDWVELRKRIY